MSLDDIVRRVTSRAGIIRVSNALNPLLWACALVPVTSWSFAYLFRSDAVLEYSLVGVGALPVLCLVVSYFILLFLDRNRLQSEEFVLRQLELAIIEKKAGSSASLDSDGSAEIFPSGRSVDEEGGEQ